MNQHTGPSCTSCARQHPHCDFTLLSAAQAGDTDAAATLLGRHAAVVYSHTASKVAPEGRDDVAHDALADALEALPSFRNQGPFRAWLRTVARRAVADYHRRRRDLLPLRAAVDKTDDAAAAELLTVEAHVSLARVLVRLPRRQRAALLLRAQLEMPYAEIGVLLGTTPPGSRLLVCRGRQRLSADRETF